MQRLVHTVALGAALIALVAGLWQEWELLSTLKRMLVSYLGFYFLGAVLALVVRVTGSVEKDVPPAGAGRANENGKSTSS